MCVSAVHWTMEVLVFLLVGVCMGVSGAPPAPPRFYQQHAPAHLQQINSLDYYLDNPEVQQYYQQAQQNKGNIEASPSQPARLETLEPDSEVELIPGAQSPQQPPQQTPVAPNIPGLAPGQRVFIVHMPVPGYRPGTIGGYQPVYIVAAAPQGNIGYPGNGYQQNTVYLDPSGQAVSPLVGYPRGVQQGANPGLFFGAPLVNSPYDLVYQGPGAGYQQVQLQGVEGNRGPVRLAQLVSLQGQQRAPANPRPAANGNASAEQKQSQSIVDSKENNEERRNARPAPPHATRTKA